MLSLKEVTTLNIGDNIKRIRKEKGLTQKQLAKKLGVSQQNLAQYESNKRYPKLATARKIATALDVYLSDLNPDWSNFSSEEIISDISDSADKAINDTAQIINETSVALQNISKTVINSSQLKQATESFLNLSEKMLVENFSKLNEDGQEEAVRQVEMLTKIPEYQRKNDDSEQD